MVDARPEDSTGGKVASRVLLVGTRADVSAAHAQLAATRNGWILDEAESFDLMMDACNAHWPEVAVVDIRGVEDKHRKSALKWLRRQARIPVLVVTAADSVDHRLLALRIGVDDHAVGPVDVRELEARIINQLRRTARLNMRIVGDLSIDKQSRRIVRRGQTITLTPNELALLERLLAAAGTVVSKHELMKSMGSAAHSTNAVEVHVSSLRRKLGQAGPALIHTVHSEGYVLRPLPSFDLAHRAELLEARERLVRQREEAMAERDRILAEREVRFARRPPSST
jgi:DNA-binding response OmpR family regulator